MKQIKLLVAGALLVGSLSVTGAAFAKEKEGARQDYVGKSGFSLQELLPTQTPVAESKSETSKPEENKSEEVKPVENAVNTKDNVVHDIYYGKGSTNKN